MVKPVATVIVPTFNHGATLRLAVESALAQSVPVEVFIIGDGVPDQNKKMIHDLLGRDARLRFFDHPKHVSRGEPYRHEALAAAKGRIVCYLCDRDLWFPDHVQKLDTLLQSADFSHSFPLHVLPDNELCFFPADLGMAIHRKRMLALWNRVPLSCAAHTLDFYRKLEEGWETTPKGEATDWHFFKKFLRRKDCRCASGLDPTAITFPSPPRLDWTEDRRLKEMALWRSKISTQAGRQSLVLSILKLAITDRDRQLARAYVRIYRQGVDAQRAALSSRLGD